MRWMTRRVTSARPYRVEEGAAAAARRVATVEDTQRAVGWCRLPPG